MKLNWDKYNMSNWDYSNKMSGSPNYFFNDNE